MSPCLMSPRSVDQVRGRREEEVMDEVMTERRMLWACRANAHHQIDGVEQHSRTHTHVCVACPSTAQAHPCAYYRAAHLFELYEQAHVQHACSCARHARPHTTRHGRAARGDGRRRGSCIPRRPSSRLSRGVAGPSGRPQRCGSSSSSMRCRRRHGWWRWWRRDNARLGTQTKAHGVGGKSRSTANSSEACAQAQ